MNAVYRTYLAAVGLLYASDSVYEYVTLDTSGGPWWARVLWFTFCALFTAIGLAFIKHWWKAK